MAELVTVGRVTVLPVQETPVSGSRAYMFPNIPEERWEPWRHYMNPRGNLTMNIASYVVRSEGHVIVVDTGLGDKPRPDFPPRRALLDNLAAAGITPADVNVVVCTHLHIDHVGWNTVRQGDGWAPTFPNARYVIDRTEWEYFTRPEQVAALEYVRDSVLPLQGAGQLDLVEAEHRVTAEVTLVPAPGHTPGHVCVALVSNGAHAMIIGDMAHHPVQLTETEWSVAIDLDPKMAAMTRARMVERLEREQSLVIGGHFPPPGVGRLVRLGERRLWQAL